MYCKSNNVGPYTASWRSLLNVVSNIVCRSSCRQEDNGSKIVSQCQFSKSYIIFEKQHSGTNSTLFSLLLTKGQRYLRLTYRQTPKSFRCVNLLRLSFRPHCSCRPINLSYSTHVLLSLTTSINVHDFSDFIYFLFRVQLWASRFVITYHFIMSGLKTDFY